MRAAFILAGLVAASASVAQPATASAKIRMVQNGKQVALGTFGFAVTGSLKRTQMLLNVDANGQKAILRTRSEVRNTGEHVMDELYSEGPSSVQGGTREKVQVRATYDRKGAIIAFQMRGRDLKRTIAQPDKQSRLDPSEWWFVDRKPTVGTTIKFSQFSTQSLKWLPTTTTYVGVKSVKVGGRTVSGNLLEQQQGGALSRIYLDDKGVLLLIETPGVRIERVW